MAHAKYEAWNKRKGKSYLHAQTDGSRGVRGTEEEMWGMEVFLGGRWEEGMK